MAVAAPRKPKITLADVPMSGLAPIDWTFTSGARADRTLIRMNRQRADDMLKRVPSASFVDLVYQGTVGGFDRPLIKDLYLERKVLALEKKVAEMDKKITALQAAASAKTQQLN